MGRTLDPALVDACLCILQQRCWNVKNTTKIILVINLLYKPNKHATLRLLQRPRPTNVEILLYELKHSSRAHFVDLNSARYRKIEKPEQAWES